MGEAQSRDSTAQELTIAALERRAGQDEATAAIERALHLADQGVQPLHAVGIGQRCTGTHTRDVFRRVKVIRLDVRQAERVGDGVAGIGLARTADAHDNQDRQRGSPERLL